MIKDNDIENRIERVVKRRVVGDDEFGSHLRGYLGIPSIDEARRMYPSSLEND